MIEISIGVDFIADYFFTLHFLYAFLCFVYIIQWIVVATLEEKFTTFDRDLRNDSNCGRHITNTITLTVVPSATFVRRFIVRIPILSFNPLIYEYYFFWVCNAFMKPDISCLHLIGFNFLHVFKR